MAKQTFSGVWRSRYIFPSTSRKADYEVEHYFRFHQKGNQLVAETIPGTSESYQIARLSINDNTATGSWQEETNPSGYYGGIVYHGAVQFVISDDKKHFAGTWVGFDKDQKINVGPWNIDYVGEEVPGKAAGAKPVRGHTAK